MKSRISWMVILAAAFLVWPAQMLLAQDANAVDTELKAIVEQVNAKLRQGHDQEKDLAENFQQLDALWAKHKAEKSDDVARILCVKATLYMRVADSAAGMALLRQVVKDYPETKSAQGAAAMLSAAEGAEAGKKVAAALVPGSVFPAFSETDLSGKPLSIDAYRGKVVLIDFWATWCGPCVAELPNVLETYKTYHDKGFEIIGIGLDQDRQKLDSFLQQKGIPWRQYFDGQGWGNKLAVRYGIEAIPATYLLDGQGRIIGTELRGKELAQAVSRALSKK